MTETSTLAFYVSSEAWYWRHNPNPRDIIGEIMVARRSSDGGCFWEFSVEWTLLQNKPACRVGVYDDAFAAFNEVPRFFTGMAAMTDPSIEDVAGLLDDLGFVDVTERENPNKGAARTMTASQIIDDLARLHPDTPVTVARPSGGAWLNIDGVTDPNEEDEPSAIILTRDDFDTRQW